MKSAPAGPYRKLFPHKLAFIKYLTTNLNFAIKKPLGAKELQATSTDYTDKQ